MGFRSALVLPLHLHPDFLRQSELSEQALDIGKQWNLSDLHPWTDRVSILVAEFTRSRVTPRISLPFKSVLTNRSLNLWEMQINHFESISCKLTGLWVLNYFDNVSAPLLILWFSYIEDTIVCVYIYNILKKVIFSEPDWTRHPGNVWLSKYIGII